MTFSTKALLRLMKQSYKGGGLKVLRAEVSLRDCFLVSGAGWALLIPKEKCPGEITGQLVAWLADMPRIGDGSWLVKGYDPQPMEAAEKAACVQEHTAGVYTLGLKLLPLRTRNGRTGAAGRQDCGRTGTACRRCGKPRAEHGRF